MIESVLLTLKGAIMSTDVSKEYNAIVDNLVSALNKSKDLVEPGIDGINKINGLKSMIVPAVFCSVLLFNIAAKLYAEMAGTAMKKKEEPAQVSEAMPMIENQSIGQDDA
jgi:hypothetical protein